MADVLTPEQRSYNMSMVRSTGTKPEISLRHILVDNNFYNFKTHHREIIGSPDFYFPDQKVAVFLDGCFWHGCTRCFRTPTTNRGFWNKKIGSNIERDRRINRRLKKDGVDVIRIREHEIKENPGGVLEKLKSSLTQTRQPKVLDLFAGAGGFSEGFIATGCDVVAHVEMNRDACDTIRTRMMYHALRKAGKIQEYKKYLLGKINRDTLANENGLQKELDSVIEAEISKTTVQNLIKEVQKRLNGEKLDIIIGGPPCQAYSHIGRSSDRKHMKRDKRKFLYEYYIAFLKTFRPNLFVFENVPGLLSAGNGIYLRNMQRLMKKAGYSTDYRILNASDFGVPQDRKRIILIGWHKNSEMDRYPIFKTVDRIYTVNDFLGDLPKLKAGEGTERITYKDNSALLRKLGIVNPELPVLLDHTARPQSRRDLEIYRLAARKKGLGKNIRYNELPARLKTHKNETAFLDRFKVVDFSGKSSHTIIAHIAKDGHYYIHPDLKQNRALTVREAARLQTFPDDFIFEGTRTSQYRQIGNAVPPMLSKIVAQKLLSCLA